MELTVKWLLCACVLMVAGVTPTPITSAEQRAPSDLFDRYFANVLAGPPCYARSYDEAHFQAHTAQRVQRIEIDLSKANSDGSPNAAERFELGFALMLKANPEWYGQAASCSTGNDAFECFLEGDGGVFRLIPAGAGLRLETGENGIALEGSADAVEISGKTGDDRVFDLVTSKEECDAATAFFQGGSE